MLDQAILEYGKERGFHPKTLERWLALSQEDKGAVLELVTELKVGENHLKDFLDWLEEISLRDGVSISSVLRSASLVRILTDPRLSRNDRLKRVKEEVRRLRFPRLAEIEEGIEKRIRALKLKPQIQISFPPGLEGGALTLQVRATRYEELKGLVRELSRAVENKEVEEIFALLEGRTDG